MATARSTSTARQRSRKQADAAIVTPPAAVSSLAEVAAVDSPPSQHSSNLTLERLLKEVARGAFFDPRKLLDADGNPLPLHLLDDETASAIAGIEVETKQRGEDAPITTIRKYKLVNRQGFVDIGLKALNGYNEDREATGVGAANALVSLLGSMRRSALPVVEQVDDDNGL